MPYGDLVIENTEVANDLRVWIRQKWKAETTQSVGQVAEDLHMIVADGDQAEALPAKLLDRLFQLHELGFAIRSPISGAIEENERTLRSLNGIEIPFFSVLAEARKRWDLFTYESARFEVLVIGILTVEDFLGER